MPNILDIINKDYESYLKNLHKKPDFIALNHNLSKQLFIDTGYYSFLHQKSPTVFGASLLTHDNDQDSKIMLFGEVELRVALQIFEESRNNMFYRVQRIAKQPKLSNIIASMDITCDIRPLEIETEIIEIPNYVVRAYQRYLDENKKQNLA